MMASSARLALRPIRHIATTCLRSRPLSTSTLLASGTSSTQPLQAKVVPLYGTGPPPEPPLPAAEFDPSKDVPGSTSAAAKAARRKRQAEMLKMARDIRKNGPGSVEGSAHKARFWKDVTVREVDGAYQISLDASPLRRPDTKQIIRLPLSKPHLASALALEWDQLTSSREATQNHLIPLTSLICRALDIADDDASFKLASPNSTSFAPIRTAISTVLLRYLDTDSLLCWAPPVDPNDPANPSSALDDEGKSLRDRHEVVYNEVVSYLTTNVFPGVSIVPVLDENSIMPRSQAPGTREVVQGWILGALSPWELAGLERATLAGKSLLGGARLIVEWSEDGCGLGVQKEVFGVEKAAKSVSVEVDWQIGRWGEVEDTHDVEKEDLRRQMGSVVLLVSGEGAVGTKISN